MDLLNIVLTNLEQVGIGVALFLGAYLSNMGLGAWRSVKVNGYDFEWKLIVESVVKFLVLGVSIALLSVVVTTIPLYATYIGIDLSEETVSTIDSVVIVGSFMTATVRYITDSLVKFKDILGVDK